MKAYKFKKSKAKNTPKNLLTLLGIIFLVGFIVILGARKLYTDNLRAVDAKAQNDVVITIASGSSLNEIADELKSKRVIKATWAFNRYVTSHEVGAKLKAGTYRIKPSQDVKSIVNNLVEGRVAIDLFTIFPAQTLTQIRQEFIDKGFDSAAVDRALNPDNYAGHPALVDRPAGADLEGYLYPESFQKTAETLPETIIQASLDEMAKRLTAELRAAFNAKGLTTHQAIILASIVEKEVSDHNPDDRPRAAQVFLKRLGMNMVLGSDVTALYGAAKAGQTTPEITFDSSYNTHLHPGLPPGPISNVSISSLKAVSNPADTDYLYFVSGDDGNTYFSKTNEEHEALTRQHCKKLCGRE